MRAKPSGLGLCRDFPSYAPSPHFVYDVDQMVNARSRVRYGLIFMAGPEIAIIRQCLLNGAEFIGTKIGYGPVPIGQDKRTKPSRPDEVGGLSTISHGRQLPVQPFNVLVIKLS